MKLILISFLLFLLPQQSPSPPYPPPHGSDLYSVTVPFRPGGVTPNNDPDKLFSRRRFRRAFRGREPLRGHLGYEAVLLGIENWWILPTRNGEWKDIIEYTISAFPGDSTKLSRICSYAFDPSRGVVFNDTNNLCASVPVGNNTAITLIISLTILCFCNRGRSEAIEIKRLGATLKKYYSKKRIS